MTRHLIVDRPMQRILCADQSKKGNGFHHYQDQHISVTLRIGCMNSATNISDERWHQNVRNSWHQNISLSNSEDCSALNH